MVDEMSAMLRRLLVLALLALQSPAFAHRLDEYLQATLVAINPDDVRLQINLTPGVDVAEQVLAQIDRNRDGVISTKEVTAYAESLKGDLTLRLDQQNLELTLTASDVPAIAELRTGHGIIQMEFAARPGLIAAGAHRLTLQSRHLPLLSVYLFNAAKPKSDLVRVTKQSRNDNQSTGEIEFTVLSGNAISTPQLRTTGTQAKCN